MTKFSFKNAEELLCGIYEVADILKIEIADNNPDFYIVAEKSQDKEVLNVALKGNRAVIKYGEKVSFFRGLMLLCKNIDSNFRINEKRNFKTNGAMFDMSRNSVFKVATVKEIMKYMSLMGLNMFMLYTEDTYEVEGYEYFGHMRGRYTKNQISEMEEFGAMLGIELVPCIQLLAHLTTALRWDAFSDMRDTHDILLTDNDETYKFIEQIFVSLSKMYKSRRVHIGMDEAAFLGQGRYLDKNKYCSKSEIFCRHLNRCRQIALNYGFKPMMWSDMFFDMAGEFGYSSQTNFSDIVKKSVPKDIDQVYWSYDSTDEAVYSSMLEKHREITDNIIFAGGIWTWSGPCPKYAKTIAASKAALSACIKKNVTEVFATVWHNGAECPLVFSLPGLMIFAEMDYTGRFDMNTIKENFEFITGVNTDDILNLEIADYPANDCSRATVKNPTRYLLYNDPLAGLLDKHAEGFDLSAFYGKISDMYKNKGTENGFFFEAFEYYKALISVLEVKADFGVKLKKAYDEKNSHDLKMLYELSYEIEKRIENLNIVHRKSWLYYNKSYGFEVHDMIYGAIKSRLQTMRFQLDRFFDDINYVIDELQEQRLPFVNIPEGETPAVFIGQRFTRLYSANVVSTVFNDLVLG